MSCDAWALSTRQGSLASGLQRYESRDDRRGERKSITGREGALEASKGRFFSLVRWNCCSKGSRRFSPLQYALAPLSSLFSQLYRLAFLPPVSASSLLRPSPLYGITLTSPLYPPPYVLPLKAFAIHKRNAVVNTWFDVALNPHLHLRSVHQSSTFVLSLLLRC